MNRIWMKMINDNINDYVPSILNPRAVRRVHGELTLTQNSLMSRSSLSLKRRISQVGHKENSQNTQNVLAKKKIPNKPIIDESSLCFTPVQDFLTDPHSSHISFGDYVIPEEVGEDVAISKKVNADVEMQKNEVVKCDNESLMSVSATELNLPLDNSQNTISYDVTEQGTISVSFGVPNCETVKISTKNSNIKKILVSHNDNATNIDCEVIESSIISIESDSDENIDGVSPSPQKSTAVAVSLEIKMKKPSPNATEKSKILILNTEDVTKLSHVIVQPPNYKLVNRQIRNRSKFKDSDKRKSAGFSERKCGRSVNLKQKRIDSFLCKSTDVLRVSEEIGCSCAEDVVRNDGQDMNKTLGVADAKCDQSKTLKNQKENESPSRVRGPKRDVQSPRRQGVRPSCSEAQRVPSARTRIGSGSSQSPRKINVDSVQFSIPSKSQSHKNALSPRNIPYYKIVAGTHFAVDAFSYGDIPNVKHYFLTHFHSDHYSGLKKGFNKLLFCSKITADLCVSRLGVNPNCIHVMSCDESVTVDGVEVTAVDANHCPGALMLVFTLPSGKSVLHTGDFRASPAMESYPVFWNKDIDSVYLDTTYCNPRYDFPTQEQSLEMALHALRQKKLVLEKNGKKFSSVLIVCGTYTIGKEKFFLNMARRVGCAVWACPEKERVLRAVEGRSFSHAPPHACQLHVVPMRDLAHEKLRSYLDSLQGAFSEVVAFKPSGWENGRNTAVERDCVTIHGIPYSEHSSFSELIRFVKFLKPKQVVPTVDISGGVKSVQKYFPCPLVSQEDTHTQSRVTDYYSAQGRAQVPAVT